MQIIGIMMVKNEERFVGQALQNIRAFCDRIIVIDTGSEDATRDRVKLQQAVRGCKIDLEREEDLRKTHRFAEQFVDSDTWVFGVDGDEIYDPVGLRYVQASIRRGPFGGNAYQLRGRYFHVCELTLDFAKGYHGPPSHNPTKFYNMRNIESWKADGEHILFQARPRVIKAGAIDEKIWADIDWDECPLRCLHMRFLSRSSVDTPATSGRRLHGEDILGYGSRGDRGGSDIYNERKMYRCGMLAFINTTDFGRIE